MSTTHRHLTHEDDIVLTFSASQEARHTAMRRANELARALVARAAADVAGQQADEDGVLPDRWESYRLPGAKRATPHRVRVSTEGLSVRQYSEFIDKVIAHAVIELDVEFDLNPAEREAARYREPVRKRAASRTVTQEAAL